MIAIQLNLDAFTEEQILDSATFRGYQLKIQEEKLVEHEDGTTTKEYEEVDNPQEPVDYIAEQAKAMLDGWLAERVISQIRQATRQAEREQAEQARAGIAQATTIVLVQ